MEAADPVDLLPCFRLGVSAGLRLTWMGLRLAPEVTPLIRSELIVYLRLVVVVDSLCAQRQSLRVTPDAWTQSLFTPKLSILAARVVSCCASSSIIQTAALFIR